MTATDLISQVLELCRVSDVAVGLKTFMFSRMLTKSASLSCSFGLFGLSRVFSFSGSRNKTNQIDQMNQIDQIIRQTGLSQTCGALDSWRASIGLPQLASLKVVHV